MLQARKRLGQNFLHDANVIRRIVAAIAPQPDERFVEIGGGLGALSVALAEHCDRLDVVEIDSRLALELSQRFRDNTRVRIHNADALKFDFSTCVQHDAKIRVAGNLPYNISTPLLFHLADFKTLILDMHFMLQKEVVDRMTARPGTKSYGRLTVMLSRWFDVEACFDIRPGSFRPQPRVMSTLARLKVRQSPRFPVADEQYFAALVTHLFSMRRKTLGRALRGRISAEALAELGIDPTVRAETLSPERLARLAAACH
ncbi:MAG: 16S rRNA (adenine(1518)-N(6)/adenine(1519)-N(6))-dimethyltransferase RsmA [Gammaproteobacteria bacterium]|jgi:16S rRNA (adenine1518-N6/adenine1519-N6)-dimethyltransferase